MDNSSREANVRLQYEHLMARVPEDAAEPVAPLPLPRPRPDSDGADDDDETGLSKSEIARRR